MKGHRSKKIFKGLCLLTFAWVLFLSLQCNEADREKLGLSKPKNNATIDLLNALGILSGTGEYTARLYYINPLITTDTTNASLIAEATTDIHPGKKKLILVHGWHFNDRDYSNYLTDLQLKDRVLAQNWSAFFATSEFQTFVAGGQYDVYAFDYLTSNGVDTNGNRFRAKMDALFSSAANNNTVVLYGHSMGGLIVKFAVYQGSAPGYLARVITTGTPFHGSPWASTAYQADRSGIGSLAGFVTDTTGGRDLAWDNDASIPQIAGAANSKLATINLQTSLDSKFNAYYGSLLSNSVSSEALMPACIILGTTFQPSDCIVPKVSATMSGHTLQSTFDAGLVDHLDVKMGPSATRVHFFADLP